MIAYIDLPLRGTHTVTGHDVLVVAFFVPVSGQSPRCIYVNDDGGMGEAAIGEVNVNWRFNDRTRKWVDVDTGEELDDDGQ